MHGTHFCVWETGKRHVKMSKGSKRQVAINDPIISPAMTLARILLLIIRIKKEDCNRTAYW
jgi:hypothetical protein